MGGKFSRDKGANFERLIAAKLRERGLDLQARRNVQECQQASVDIITKLPLAIQCKNLARWGITPHGIWRQASTGRIREADQPVGIVKITKNPEILCFVELDFFLDLLEKAYGQDETPLPKTDHNCKL